MTLGDGAVLAADRLDSLLVALRDRGYRVVGPRVKDGAIVYDAIDSVADLPRGWTDEQERGRYRIVRRGDDAFFGYVSGPQSWKRFLHRPEVTLWKARRDERGFAIDDAPGDGTRDAFLGVRACELAAIRVQDKVLLDGPYVDPSYRRARERVFLVAVNCVEAGGTCFCASMKTGPRATTGFDLALTELLTPARHDFLVEIGSERGAEVAAALPLRPASPADLAAAEAAVDHARSRMGRALETAGLEELLYRNAESPHWDAVALRCLSCANCTMVCPTCFCVTVEDVSDLAGNEAERRRRWDSCFTTEFSYIHGGSVRTSASARYRQWITHKLAAWRDQFGTSGCVGCGRCITWCPAGIDITAEVEALRDSERGNGRDDRNA
jgi:formate hydrogenlyase subunit 6/NADH:ubiquinone oxidoreductase subunit I